MENENDIRHFRCLWNVQLKTYRKYWSLAEHKTFVITNIQVAFKNRGVGIIQGKKREKEG